MQDDAGWNRYLRVMLTAMDKVMLAGTDRKMLPDMCRTMQAGIDTSGQCWLLWTG